MSYSDLSGPGTLLDRKGGLRELESQIAYEDVVSFTESQAETFLIDNHVVLKQAPPTMKCWVCSADLKPSKGTKKYVFANQKIRCSNRQCSGGQPRLYCQKFAFTPLMGECSAGYKPSCKEFVRCAYTLGTKSQNDSAGHYVRQRGDTIRKTMHILDRYYHQLRVCLAYVEFKRGREQTFRNEIVDTDAVSTAMKAVKMKRPAACFKKPSSCHKRPAGANLKRPASAITTVVGMEYQGRLLTMKGRFSKTWCVVPLCNTQVQANAPLPPETLDDVLDHIVRSMDIGTIGGIDGSQAFKSACRQAAATPLQGVRHQGNIFTPLVRLEKRLLSKDVTATLSTTAMIEGSCVLEMKTCFLVVGGNNAAEGVHGHLNNTLRRLGLKSGPRSNATVSSLAAAALLRRPGFDTVLEAVKLYRDDLLSGSLKVSPKESFARNPKWLPSPEPRKAVAKKPAGTKQVLKKPATVRSTRSIIKRPATAHT